MCSNLICFFNYQVEVNKRSTKGLGSVALKPYTAPSGEWLKELLALLMVEMMMGKLSSHMFNIFLLEKIFLCGTIEDLYCTFRERGRYWHCMELPESFWANIFKYLLDSTASILISLINGLMHLFELSYIILRRTKIILCDEITGASLIIKILATTKLLSLKVPT